MYVFSRAKPCETGSRIKLNNTASPEGAMFSYRAGQPFWKFFARLGCPVVIRVSVLRDNEARFFVAQSDDLLPDFGCVAESPTWEGLHKELSLVLKDASESIFSQAKRKPTFAPFLCFSLARTHAQKVGCTPRSWRWFDTLSTRPSPATNISHTAPALCLFYSDVKNDKIFACGAFLHHTTFS